MTSSSPGVRSWRTVFLTLRDETLISPPPSVLLELLRRLFLSQAHDAFVVAAASLPPSEVTSDVVLLVELASTTSQCEDAVEFLLHACHLIHSKKRNRLAQQRLNDLVFVKYNRALRRRYDARDRIDPILLTDIDDSNELLMGRMEEDNDAEVEQEDLVFDDELLIWGTVATATGVEEEIYRTRLSKGKNVVPTKTLEKRSISKMKTPTPLVIRETTTPLVIRETNTPLVLRNADDIDEEEVEYNEEEEEYNDSGEDDEDIVFSEDE